MIKCILKVITQYSGTKPVAPPHVYVVIVAPPHVYVVIASLTLKRRGMI
jgi:hypothetical protein